MKFEIKIILDVANQSIEDMKQEDIEDKCLYIEDIKIIEENKKEEQ